jgi:molybdate transport system regulatory protein
VGSKTLSAKTLDAKNGPRLSIRLDLSSGDRIGPGKIVLLEAIRDTGSISAGARQVGMSYRRAWLLVEQINAALREPAVTGVTGGRRGGGALVTPAGERLVAIYRSIESAARKSAAGEFRAVEKIARKEKRKG